MSAKTYVTALIESARIAVLSSGDAPMWEDIITGAFAVLVLFMRIVLLVTFPVSVPILALLIVKDDRAMRERYAKERARADAHTPTKD